MTPKAPAFRPGDREPTTLHEIDGLRQLQDDQLMRGITQDFRSYGTHLRRTAPGATVDEVEAALCA